MDAKEREQLIDQAEERITTLIFDCYQQVEAICAETEELTGQPVKNPGRAPRAVSYTDLDLPTVAEVQRRCAAFQSAAEALVPLLRAAPHRTAGSVLKTSDWSVATRIRKGLQQSEFFEETR